MKEEFSLAKLCSGPRPHELGSSRLRLAHFLISRQCTFSFAFPARSSSPSSSACGQKRFDSPVKASMRSEAQVRAYVAAQAHRAAKDKVASQRMVEKPCAFTELYPTAVMESFKAIRIARGVHLRRSASRAYRSRLSKGGIK